MARIGMVNFINTAPIYEIWKERVDRPDWQMIGAPPTTLNSLLAEDRLDLGFVSSYEYARRPQRYQIMADLSISATGPVGSVFLFSKLNPRALSGKQVLLTGQSDTSVCLAKIILEEFFQTRPEYQVGEVFSELEHVDRADAVLAIGDEALRLKLENRYPVQLDLGETWHQATSLPLCSRCARCARSFCVTRRKRLEKFTRPCWLAASKAWPNCPGSATRWPNVFPWIKMRVPVICNPWNMIWDRSNNRPWKSFFLPHQTRRGR